MELKLTLCTLIGLVALVSGAADLTVQAEAKGTQVVEATIIKIRESCLFPIDHLLLRRMAFMMTKDGNDPKTYRQGFDGGIWQVEKSDFQLTQSSAALKSIRDKITAASPLGVSWFLATWSDLRKPLFSGIAAILTYIRWSSNNIPTSIENQAALYARTRDPPVVDAANHFLTEASKVDVVCAASNLDLAVIVDTSSSLSVADFNRSLDFISQIVGFLKVGTNDARIAFVTFSSGYTLQFNFNQYSTVADVQRAVKSAVYTAGATETDKVLEYAYNTLFTAAAGSRASAAKVALLITDGRSDDRIATVNNAKLLRRNGIILFAIGIGSLIDSQELQDVVSTPSCTHLQELGKYSELDSITTEIKQVSCQAPVVLNPGNYNFACGSRNLFRIDRNSVSSIVIKPRDGILRVYGSYSTSNPNQANRDFSVVASNYQPVIVYIRYQTSPLYLSVESDSSLSGRCSSAFSIDLVQRNVLRKVTTNVCAAGSSIYQCSTLDLLRALYKVTKTSQSGICQVNLPGYYPNEFDITQFYFCDGQGNIYLVQCPINYYYKDSAKDCVVGPPPTSPPTTTTTTTTPRRIITSGNWFGLCTQANYDLGKTFFPYPPDPHKFIKCAEWPGQGSILNCQPNKIWLQSALTCVYEKTVTDVSKQQFLTITPVPGTECIAEHTDPKDLYHPFRCDNTKFIHCDAFGDRFVKSCPPGQIWHQDIMNCIPGVAKKTC